MLLILTFFLCLPVSAKPKIFETIESNASSKTAAELVEPGHTTIVEFYVDWCETCKSMPGRYKILKKNQPDTRIKRVRLPRDFDFATVCKRHGIQMCQVPHFEIFNPDGSLFLKDRCTDGQAFRYVFSILQQMTSSKNQNAQ